MNDYILRVLEITSFEYCDGVWWRTPSWPGCPKIDSPLIFLVNCNDLFYWACSDAEPILPTNLDLLEQSIKDCEYHWEWLFCCRARKERPQGACYKYIEEKYWPLFDACGPSREAGVGNPRKHPSELTEEERKAWLAKK